jgi:hypothetical protein
VFRAGMMRSSGVPQQARCSLYVIQARGAERAVVFRRGPSRQVMLATWNTDDDTIEHGQWLKGRIYERRCDLSPDGEFLVYFAASWRKPYDTWTAVSRPPFLTALALWPKGDAWGGGGRFAAATRLELNHGPNAFALAEGFSLPRWLDVVPMGEYAGRGEDEPAWTARLERDGWTLVSRGRVVKGAAGARVWLTIDPPAIWEKPHPTNRRYVLRMIVSGIHEQDGGWYVTHHEVIDAEGEPIPLGRSDWADWSSSGDLLFAADGQLLRVRHDARGLRRFADRVVIADFRELTFTERRAPEEKTRWGPRRR